MDMELFELACQRAGTAWLLPEERLETCMSALALYRNDFLSKAMGESWVRPLADHYHTMYVRLVQTTVPPRRPGAVGGRYQYMRPGHPGGRL